MTSMSPGNPFILGLKDGHDNDVCVGLKTERNIITVGCCCVRKLYWVFPAVMHRRTCLRCFPAFACRWTLDFSRRGSLHSCECRLVVMVAVRWWQCSVQVRW